MPSLVMLKLVFSLEKNLTFLCILRIEKGADNMSLYWNLWIFIMKVNLAKRAMESLTHGDETSEKSVHPSPQK